jgi:hypothetical protein
MSTKNRSPYKSMVVITVLLMLSMQTPVFAGIVTTAKLIDAQQSEQNRAHLNELLARQDVQQALTSQGVDVAAARERVASMTDAEIQTLAARMNQLPAGGRLSTVELLLVIIIIILIL